jgi:hypothetical protein
MDILSTTSVWVAGAADGKPDYCDQLLDLAIPTAARQALRALQSQS